MKAVSLAAHINESLRTSASDIAVLAETRNASKVNEGRALLGTDRLVFIRISKSSLRQLNL